MSSRFNDFEDDEFEDEDELEDELDAESGRSPNNPFSSPSSGASVRGAGLPSTPARPPSTSSPAPGGAYSSPGGQRPAAPGSSPGSATAFGAPSGSPSRPNIPGSSAPASGSSGVQSYQRPPLGSSGGTPSGPGHSSPSSGTGQQRPGDARAPSSGGYGSSAASSPISKPGEARPPQSSASSSSGLYGSASSAPPARPASSSPTSPTRPDERKPARDEGGGGLSKLGGLFGRGEKDAKTGSSSGKPASKPAEPKGNKDGDKGGGLFGRFGRGGDKKDDKAARGSSSMPGGSSALSSSSRSPYGGTSSSPMGSSSSSQRSATPYGNVPASSAPGKGQAQTGRSAGKGGGPRKSLFSRLNPFGARGESKTARTARTGPAVEVQPVSFARDKQLEIAGLALSVSGIVLLLSSLSPVQGSIPQQVNTFLSSLFGWGAIVVPILMVPMGIWMILIRVGQNTPVVALTRVLGLILLFISALVLMQFIDALSYPPGQGQSYDQYLAALENVLLPLSSDFGRGGGRIGGTLYFQLIRNFTEPGGFVILIGVLAVSLMLTLSVSAYEIAAIVIGSFRNLRDARRRRQTRLTAERAAAQLAAAPAAAGPALAAPATNKATAALPAAVMPGPATQPLPLDAPAQERSIPILMGGRPLNAADAEDSANAAPTPFPALTPVPKPGELATVSAAKDAPAEDTTKQGGVFGRLKGALPAVGAATAMAARSTVSAMTPDKETENTAAGAADANAKKGGPLGKLFSRSSSSVPAAEAAPVSAESKSSSSAPGTAPASTTTTAGAAALPPLTRAPLPAAPQSEPDDEDEVDVFDDDLDELDEHDETGTPPARLGDLLRPPAETSKPAAAAPLSATSTTSPAATPTPASPPPLTRPGTSATGGVTPFSRPPLGAATRPAESAQERTPATPTSTSPDAPANGAQASSEPKQAAATAQAAESAKPPATAAASTPVRPAEGLRKAGLPLDDEDDWSHLPPARPKSAADHGRAASATTAENAKETPAAAPPGPVPDLQSRLETLRSAAPPSRNEPVIARPESRAPRPWEKNDHPTAPPGVVATTRDARADEDEHDGVAAAASAALRPDPAPAKPAESARPATTPAPPPFSRTTTSAPQATISAPSAPAQRATGGRANWRLPDFTGLLAAGADQEMNHDKLLARARTIEDTLASFGAPGRVVEVRTGPVITQFGVEPDYVEVRGKKNRVKVSAIASLDKDLQLALGAKSIRIEAPVPGKGYVGIEVPNEKPSVVRLRDVMESNEFRRIQSPLAIALGQGVDGTPVAADLGNMPHLLIAGTTGSGKSVAVNTIIASLLLRNPPDRLKFIMVDPKRVELTGYNGIPHLVAPVVVELERVVSVLKWVTREMDERYRKFALAGARNIEDYNNHLPGNEPIMPYIVVIIDELADLMMMAPDETEKVITRIAALARATGIHLVIATQRPSVDVVTGLIKANFPARIAFAVAGGVDSRVILDQPGAERLLGRGDMLFMSGDTPAPARLQGVYVSDAEIGNITRYWRNLMADPSLANAGKPILSDFHLDEQAKQDAAPARGSGIGYGNTGRPSSGGPARNSFLDDEPDDELDENADSDDVLYEQAVDTVRRLNKASVSLLQRRLRIGYTRAARLIDLMEERGVVGPAVEGSKPRDVLPLDKSKPV